MGDRMEYGLGVDIGGTKINLGLIDEKNNLIAKKTVPVPNDKSCRSVLSAARGALDSLLTDNSISIDGIKTGGVGVPGTISDDGLIAKKVPNLDWENVNAADEFNKIFNIPAVLIQDSRAAAFGEYILGGHKNAKVLVCVTLGTGIGTGIVINGGVFGGGFGSAGEIGHVCVMPGGRECGCGKRGCLEKYAAGRGMEITAREAFRDENITAPDIFEMAGKNNKTAADIINGAVVLLGNAMVSIVNLLSPEVLLLSGGISRQKKLFAEPLISYIQEHAYSQSDDKKTHVGYAALGEDAPMLGAALYPRFMARLC